MEFSQVSLLHSYTLLAHWIKPSLSSLFPRRKQVKVNCFYIPGSVYGRVGAGYLSGFIFPIKLAVLWHCTLKGAVRGKKAVVFPIRNNLCVPVCVICMHHSCQWTTLKLLNYIPAYKHSNWYQGISSFKLTLGVKVSGMVVCPIGWPCDKLATCPPLVRKQQDSAPAPQRPRYG